MSYPDETTVILRRLTMGDAGEVAGLVTALDYPSTQAQVHERLRQLLSDPSVCALGAALAPGAPDGSATLVGLVTAALTRHIELDQPYGRITALVVAEGWRGRGVGPRLLRAAEEWLRARGAVRAAVNSSTYRKAAHRFYQREGYQITGVRLVRELPDPQAPA